MPFSKSFEGFRLAYDRRGSGSPVVLLHGWPGDRTDYSALALMLSRNADVIIPDLRGFGESDKHTAQAEGAYSGHGQAHAIIALLEELKINQVVLGGYDVGSFVAQTVARVRPDLVRALVVSPPLPGAGKRVLEINAVKEFWYTSFQQLRLAEELVDGKPAAVRAYLRHFWDHWSGPNYIVDERRLDHLTERYATPGAFTASMMWYRSSSNPVTAYASEQTPAPADRLSTPVSILWQEHDPIFPYAWSDHLSDYFTNYRLERVDGVGHFMPLEATDRFAAAIQARLS